VRGLSWPFNETYKRSFNSFTELQVTFSPRHVMNININFFSTEPSVHKYQYAGPAECIGGLSEEGSVRRRLR